MRPTIPLIALLAAPACLETAIGRAANPAPPREPGVVILHAPDASEAETLATPRAELSKYAPRILTIQIPVDKIREVIGPGGKVIKKITEETGCQIDIEDSGEVRIAAVNMEGSKRAEELIRNITEDPEVDRVYQGKVRSIVNFGAFVEIVPGRDGLLHVSEIDWGRTERVEDVLNVGDMVMVKVIGVDKEGKVMAQFTNGQTRALAQVVLSRFTNPDGLANVGDNHFLETVESGAALAGAPTINGLGRVLSGTVEQSNVDLGKEFVDMIITQRAFQANSRAITTSDEMLQELVNLKR